MSVKSLKAALQGAIRTVGDWARPQESVSGKIDMFVERWNSFEKEMDNARTKRNGPLRWETPNRSVDEGVVASTAQVQQSAAQVQSVPTPASVQSPAPPQLQQPTPPTAVEEVSKPISPVNENKPNIENDFAADPAENSKGELSRYLKAHRKEVEVQRENLKRQIDRNAFRSLPRLERHLMTNPQKLYTPVTKLKFSNAVSIDKPKFKGMKKKDVSEDLANDVTPKAPEVVAGTQAFIDSTGFTPPALEDMGKRVMTKLAAWSKSLEPPEPEAKPPQPPTVLKILTAKPNLSPSQIKKEPQVNTSLPTSGELRVEKTIQTSLPPLIERLQTTSFDARLPEKNPTFQIIPYTSRTSLPTPSSDPMGLPHRNKRKIHKPPMTFESSLTSIECRMDLSTTQTSPSVSLK